MSFSSHRAHHRDTQPAGRGSTREWSVIRGKDWSTPMRAFAIVTLSLIVFVSVGFVRTPHAGAVASCNGVPATIQGSGTIKGTGGPDVIVGSAGADVIKGNGGNDLIC